MAKVIARGQVTINVAIDGEDAVVYFLRPSVDVIRKDAKGILDVKQISCQAFKTVGNATPVVVTGLTINYCTSINATEVMYSAAINTVATWKWIEFILYSASGSTVLDRKRVPVVSDAQSSDVAATVDEAVEALRIGKYNILRNSGFTGDFVTSTLSADTDLIDSSELFSDPFAHWTKTGTVTQKAESQSESGYSASITNGSIKQELFYQQIAGESYVISFKAKGTRVTVSCGNVSTTKDLTGAYKQYVIKFTSLGGTVFTVTGTCEITELQLERGTVASAWGRSFLDNQTDLVRFESLLYLTDAIRNANTSINGGLILTAIIQLGNYVDQVMKQVTAGVSGTYNNSDSVAFWAGGTFEQAIATVAKYKNNPGYQPSEAELANMAKYVTTHGGRTILNDVILRGYIYALGGVFKGKVEIAGGKILLNEDGSGHLSNGNIFWDADGNAFSNTVVRRSANIITPETIVHYIGLYDYDEEGQFAMAYINIASILGGIVFSGNFELDNGYIIVRKDGIIYRLNIAFPSLSDVRWKYNALFIGEHTAIQNESNGSILCSGNTHLVDTGDSTFFIKQNEIWTFVAEFYPLRYGQKNVMTWLRAKII